MKFDILIAAILSMAVIHDINAYDDWKFWPDYEGYYDPGDGIPRQYCVSDITCNGHGRCPSRDDVAVCKDACICTGNYTGTFCTIPPDCTPNGGECGPNGECIIDTLTCKCLNNYKGRLCTIRPFCLPTGNECGQFGECNYCSDTSKNFCQCHSGYGGIKCTEAPECTEGGIECRNGETCDFSKTPFVCHCHPKDRVEGDKCGGQQVTSFVGLLLLVLFGGSVMSP